jgi:enoyl-CoA hydratase/carnithine racemase
LETRDLNPTEAVVLGLATAEVAEDCPLPIPDDASVASLTAARDLMRASARGSSGLALELASFRLLFAAGDPEEGARAFLEKRDPKF